MGVALFCKVDAYWPLSKIELVKYLLKSDSIREGPMVMVLCLEIIWPNVMGRKMHITAIKSRFTNNDLRNEDEMTILGEWVLASNQYELKLPQNGLHETDFFSFN